VVWHFVLVAIFTMTFCASGIPVVLCPGLSVGYSRLYIVIHLYSLYSLSPATYRLPNVWKASRFWNEADEPHYCAWYRQEAQLLLRQLALR